MSNPKWNEAPCPTCGCDACDCGETVDANGCPVPVASSPSRPAPADAEQVRITVPRRNLKIEHYGINEPYVVVLPFEAVVAALSAAGYVITPKALLDELLNNSPTRHDQADAYYRAHRAIRSAISGAGSA